jgi:predicted HTH domain antitoxin
MPFNRQQRGPGSSDGRSDVHATVVVDLTEELCGAKSMNVAVNLPEDIAKRLQATWNDLSRGTLEAIALEGYRSQALTRDQVARLLGLSFWEAEAFLKERRAYLPYDDADLEQDRQVIDRLRPR